MHNLKVIGIEDGALIAVSEDGDRYRVEIDAVMQTKIRQLQSARTSSTRVAPRDIQAHIRAGMTREQVAAATGASVEDVERYERPVLAEREHVLSQALATSVHVAGDDAHGHTFGAIIRDRLTSLDASNERWACWKDELQGWVVKVEFTANTVDHDARWAFDVRGQALQPLNSEAITLSQHGEIRGGLIPKLRAVDTDAPSDRSRFDSGAFVLTPGAHAEFGFDELDSLDVVPGPVEHSLPTATAAAVNREEEPAHSPNDTADLLEALRKRRGERQSAPEFDESSEPSDFADTIVIERETITISHDHHDSERAEATPAAAHWAAQPSAIVEPDEPAAIAHLSDAPKRKGGRTSLPSWDEIVFGSNGNHDDDAPL